MPPTEDGIKRNEVISYISSFFHGYFIILRVPLSRSEGGIKENGRRKMFLKRLKRPCTHLSSFVPKKEG